jgi:hypothetical protein
MVQHDPVPFSNRLTNYYSFKTLDKMTAFERNSAPHRYFKFVQDYFSYIVVIVTLQQAGVWLI